MEPRGCGTTHFIQTIRGGLELKVRNITSHESSVIQSKILKDVYDSEDAKDLKRLPSGLVFDHQQPKYEGPCFLVADRTLREVKHETDEYATHADDDMNGDLDDETTLKQLKERLITKKRKHIPFDYNSHPANANEKTVEDESDLNESLINWKSKHSKSSKNKRKHTKISVSSYSTIEVAIKSEQTWISECFTQVGGGPAPVSRVKAEVPDAEQLECQNKIFSGDSSLIGLNEVPNPGQKMVPSEYNGETLLCVNPYENCVTNVISYDHLEYVEPISILVPRVGKSVKLETPETVCSDSLELHSVEVERQREIHDSHPCKESLSEYPNPGLCSNSNSSFSVDIMPEETIISSIEVPGTAIIGCMGLPQNCNSILSGDKTKADFPYEPNETLSPEKYCGSNLDSVTPSKTEENRTFIEDTIADKQKPSTCSIMRNELNFEGHVEDEPLKAVDDQCSAVAITGAENVSISENKTCFNAEITLMAESQQPPKKIFSARKAFSPSSQEQLQLVANYDEICNNSNQNIVLECKEKLIANKNEKNGSPRSDIQNGEVTLSNRRPGQVSQRKVTISPRHFTRKSLIAKGNLEGPRFSRALPNISSTCMSFQGCVEGVIAFSQRQMHDMEMLTDKLMNELKSMKDIVEQKLLFEAYRNASVKNDADEVKLAINNATKVEETAKRWMSMMAKDCTRFCKIMKMTTDSTSASKDTVPREKRKITFADEAGGELCHIKFFENGIVAPGADAEADAVKQ